jgi:hypothetical protein
MRFLPTRAARRLLLGALALAPAAASAQSVAGRVLAATTRRPIGHVAVTLLDSAGRPAARAETDAEGVFYVDAPAAGSYALDFAPADGSPPLRTPARPLAVGQEVQVEYVLAPPQPTAPPAAAAAAATSEVALLLGVWHDPQPYGWPELELRLERQSGDSVFGELLVRERTPYTLAVRGRYAASHLELRAWALGEYRELVIVGEFHGHYITGRRRYNASFDHYFPAINFRRRRY